MVQFSLKNISKETMYLQSVSSKASFSFAAVKQKIKFTVDPQSRFLQDQKHYCAHTLRLYKNVALSRVGTGLTKTYDFHWKHHS